MTSPILFVGGEDIDFVGVNGTIGTNYVNTTTANSFRSGYARLAMSQISSQSQVDTTHYIRASFASTTQFWVSYRVNHSGVSGGAFSAATGALIPIRFLDSNGVVRLYLKYTAVNASPNDTFQLFTENAALTSVQVGSTSTGRFMSTTAGTSYIAVADKIDIFVNYAVAGQLTVYLNGVQTFTYSGDITTNSQTTLAAVDLGQVSTASGNASTTVVAYSEVIASTRDTRNMSILTQVATANGNAHAWDGGTAANAAAQAQATAQTSPQFSGTANQIQEYQVTPAVPTGSFSVISVVQHAQATVGSSGPTKFEFMVRTGGADFTSTPDTTPSLAWALYSYNWDTNPNTTVAWQTTELAASSTSFNYGLKSIA